MDDGLNIIYVYRTY